MVIRFPFIKRISMKKISLEESITAKLTEVFTPELLKIQDESFKHAGHNAAAQKGGTHFHIHMVSSHLTGLTRVQQHRWVYEVLSEEIEQGVHALRLDLAASRMIK